VERSKHEVPTLEVVSPGHRVACFVDVTKAPGNVPILPTNEVK
jgi:hypothetical protein